MTTYVDLGFTVEFTATQMAFLRSQYEEHNDSVNAIAWRLLRLANPGLLVEVELAATRAVDAAIAEGRQDGP